MYSQLPREIENKKSFPCQWRRVLTTLPPSKSRMKLKSPTPSGFSKRRLLLGLAFCSFGGLLAFFALAGIPQAVVPAVAEKDEAPRYMPVPGGEADDLARMELMWHDRLTYPTGRFDPAWVRQAAEQDSLISRELPLGINARSYNRDRSTAGLDPTTFTALGPAPERMTGCSGCYDYGITQGRVNAIAVDPTTTTNGSITAYIGAVNGGVWKTTNCCTPTTSWTVTTDDPLIATTSVDTLAMDPRNHNVLYAGTGDLNFGSFSMGSQGILKTTDGGKTWAVLGSAVFGAAYVQPAGQFPQYDAVGKVRVDPNSSSRVVAGTKKGLFFSYDGGVSWTGPCVTNNFNTQRHDITGLELTDMGGGVTRILAAIGTRGFATPVQYDLGAQGANGLYKGTMPASGCPTDFTLLTRNDNGFVFGTAVTGSPYTTGALMNAGSGDPYVNATTGNQLSRMDIAVAPSNPNYIYAQVGSIAGNTASGCGGGSGCQLGVWSSIDGGNSWSFMQGSAGGSLRACATGGTSAVGSGAAGGGDYPQNWYDQGLAVDPNNPDRLFVDTFDTWVANRTGSTFYNVTCGYSGTPVANHVVHVDHHALAFIPGSSSILLEGSDGGIFATTNADVVQEGTARPTWFNMDNGLNTIEFYAGDISGNFANASNPMAVGGAQDNGPSSVTFNGTPTGPVQWQMGLGGDGFSGQIDPIGTGQTQAQGTMVVTTGGTIAGETFKIGSVTFTWVASGTSPGNVVASTTVNTAATNIRTAINRDSTEVTASGTGANVIVTSVIPGPVGNFIEFTENGTNTTMNGNGFLGGTTQGGLPGSLRVWQGNNSGGLSRCVSNCSNSGATYTSSRGAWTGDQQSFVLPINLFHGGIPGGDDCDAAGPTTGCGRLLAATTRVYETISGAGATVPTTAWYITNNPVGAAAGPNLTKGTLGNRSYINQVKYSPKYYSVAIVGTNDGNVQIGFNLGTGTASQANWVNVTGGNSVLPNRPILSVALDPVVPARNVPVGYAGVGGFNANSPTTPGHVFQVTCGDTCATFTWLDKTGNLPDIPVGSVISNPNFPQQVFAGTDFGLYYTNDITAASPVWYRFKDGMPAVMIWDMQIDRGATTLSVWTRGRGAFAWPLPSGPVPTPVTLNSVVSRKTHAGAGPLDLDLGLNGVGIECRTGGANGEHTVVFTFANPLNSVASVSLTGTGTVASSAIGSNPSEYVVQLTGVTDAQHLGITLNGVQDNAGNLSNTVRGGLNVLLGDTTGDTFVNSGDVIQTRNRSGGPLTAPNFRSDVNLDGAINGGDAIIVRAAAGGTLTPRVETVSAR